MLQDIEISNMYRLPCYQIVQNHAQEKTLTLHIYAILKP